MTMADLPTMMTAGMVILLLSDLGINQKVSAELSTLLAIASRCQKKVLSMEC